MKTQKKRELLVEESMPLRIRNMAILIISLLCLTLLVCIVGGMSTPKDDPQARLLATAHHTSDNQAPILP